MPLCHQRFAVLLPTISTVLLTVFCAQAIAAPESDRADVIGSIDRSVLRRDDNVLSYTVTERYTVFRNGEAAPSAEMKVKTTYTKGAGKTYQILSESGPALLRKEVLERALANERSLNQPANRAHELITSANYKMAEQGSEAVDGRDCFVVSIAPRQNADYLFGGRIWVEQKTGDIVRLDGVASKSASMMAGPAHVVRSYAQVDGFPMATHVTATVSSWLLGPTRVEIEYTGYAITQKAGSRQ